MNFKEAVAFMGLEAHATSHEIKAKYKALAKKYHPDKKGDNASFIKLHEAYEIMLNPPKEAPIPLQNNRHMQRKTDNSRENSKETQSLFDSLKEKDNAGRNVFISCIDPLNTEKLLKTLAQIKQLKPENQFNILAEKDIWGRNAFTLLSLQNAQSMNHDESLQSALHTLIGIIGDLPKKRQLTLFLASKPLGLVGKNPFEALYNASNDKNRTQLCDLLNQFSDEKRMRVLLSGIPSSFIKQAPQYIVSCLNALSEDILYDILEPQDAFGESVKAADELLSLAMHQHAIELVVKIANSAQDDLLLKMLEKAMFYQNPVNAFIPLIPRIMDMSALDQERLFQSMQEDKTSSYHPAFLKNSAFKMVSLLYTIELEAEKIGNSKIKSDILSTHQELKMHFLQFLSIKNPSKADFDLFQTKCVMTLDGFPQTLTTPKLNDIWKAFVVLFKTGKMEDFIEATTAIYKSISQPNMWKNKAQNVHDTINELEPNATPSSHHSGKLR